MTEYVETVSEWVETIQEWDDTPGVGGVTDVFIKNLTDDISKGIGGLTATQLGGVLIGG